MKIQIQDRDRNFHRSWKSVRLELKGYSQEVEIINMDKPSFWVPKCRELISKNIGIWLIENNFAPCLRGKPPKLNIEPQGENQFLLKLP